MNRNRSKIVSRVVLLGLVVSLVALLIYGTNLWSRQDRDASLYAAVERSNLAAVRTLLREHADPNVRAPMSFRWTFWRSHTADFRSSALRCAVERAVMSSFGSDGHRTTPSREEAIVLALLDAGAHAAPNDGGQNLLETTLSSGHSHLAVTTEALLKHGAPLPTTLSGQPLLASAINWENSPSTIQALLHAGADIKGEAGRAALAAAYRYWNPTTQNQQNVLAIFHSLLEAGADPNTPIQQSTMLYDALRFRHPQFVQMLLQAHADPNAAPSNDLPLLYVALDSAPEVFQELLEAGADPNGHDVNGEPVLWYAVIHEIPEPVADKARKVELLLKHGASVRTVLPSTQYGTVAVSAAAHRAAKDYHIDPSILTLLDRAASAKQPK